VDGREREREGAQGEALECVEILASMAGEEGDLYLCPSYMCICASEAGI